MFIAYLIFKFSFFLFFYKISRYQHLIDLQWCEWIWLFIPFNKKREKNMTIYPWLCLHFITYILFLNFFFFSFTTIWRESRKVQCHYVPWKLIYSFSVNSVMSFSWITFYDEVLTLEKSLIIYKFKIKLWSLAAEVWKRLKKKKNCKMKLNYKPIA